MRLLFVVFTIALIVAIVLAVPVQEHTTQFLVNSELQSTYDLNGGDSTYSAPFKLFAQVNREYGKNHGAPTFIHGQTVVVEKADSAGVEVALQFSDNKTNWDTLVNSIVDTLISATSDTGATLVEVFKISDSAIPKVRYARWKLRNLATSGDTSTVSQTFNIGY